MHHVFVSVGERASNDRNVVCDEFFQELQRAVRADVCRDAVFCFCVIGEFVERNRLVVVVAARVVPRTCCLRDSFLRVANAPIRERYQKPYGRAVVEGLPRVGESFYRVARGYIFRPSGSARCLSLCSYSVLCISFGKDSPAPFAPYHEERYRYEAEEDTYECFLSHTILDTTLRMIPNYACSW